MQALHRAVTDAALGGVDDALEGQIIVGRGDDFQVSKRIAHFGTFIKTRAADHAVRHTQSNEAVLEGAHLEGGAHQDRHVVEHLALPLQVLDVVADGAGFLVAVPVRAHRDAVAIIAGGAQCLAKTAFIFGNQPRGGPQDLRRRAVIAFQPDHFRSREILLEAQNIVDLGAAPAIDRLVVVADTADIFMALG